MRLQVLTVTWLFALLGPVIDSGSFAGQTGGWPTGAEIGQQLAAPVSVSWSNLPLARALKSLGTSQHMAIVLDRRVDPERPISLVIDQESLGEALNKIARHLKLGYCQFGPIAYFGPPAMARRLRTMATLRLEQLRQLSTPATRKLLMMRSWHWDDLTEPRQLVDELAAEAEVEIVGADKIPHDLWPAADLPPMSWIDRLTLLAAQFELSFELDKTGRRAQLVAAPATVALTRSYQAGADAATVARRWAKALPDARVIVDKNRIRIEGRLEDHEAVQQRLRGKPTEQTTVTAGKEVYQLSVENAALEQVVQQVAERLNLEFDWDRAAIDAAGIATDQLVTVKVKDASLDELVRAVLAGTGLAFRRDDRKISLYPTEREPGKQ
jgi:secretin/TonB-like protein